MADNYQVLLKNTDQYDLTNIDVYIKQGGYKGLEKARRMQPRDLIAEIKASGLRGRGGAGFNTGVKLGYISPAADEKYIICNLDEGEPGTYKDRILCEKNPHAVIEGLAICAEAIETEKAFIYCRAEYVFLIERLKQAIQAAQRIGVLNNLDIEIRMGAGAYICGEETALIESIEGHRGQPRFKPPYPTIKGLWNRPTVIINVETVSNLPFILNEGAETFASIGAANYPGTKLLTLSGDINRTGCFEVPTDYILRDVVYKLGEGVKNNRNLKAVQVGGSSGAFLPAAKLDMAIDFETMASVGAVLGSGAVLILDDTRDMVDLTLKIAQFFEHESCGKCTPCREGTFRCREILQNVQAGKAQMNDIDNLLVLVNVMQQTSLCGLGQSVINPVASSIRYFLAEYKQKLLA